MVAVAGHLSSDVTNGRINVTARVIDVARLCSS
jgi:hypothetical protein